MFKEIIELIVAFVIEDQAFNDLVDVLISLLYLWLWGGKMSIDNCYFGLTHFDRTADSSFVSTNTKDTSADLGQRETTWKQWLNAAFVQDHLEKTHLSMGG